MRTGMDLVELAPNVYACLQQDRGLGCSNSGLVRRDGGLIVDTFWDLPHTREMMATYAPVMSGTVRRVVNTHHNGDHCWGNQLFADAEIIGHRGCAASFGKDAPPAMLQAMKGLGSSDDPSLALMARRLEDWDFRGIELTPPTTLMDDRLDLDLDGIRVELLYVGPAHTVGDVIVHLPHERIVFTGDILFVGSHPIMWAGPVGNWLRACDLILGLDVDIVVPGHGPITDKGGVRETKAYFEWVSAEARRRYDAGMNVEAAARDIVPGRFAQWTDGERIVANVNALYREFAGTAGEPDIVSVFAAMARFHNERRTPGRSA
jgi:cyclase